MKNNSEICIENQENEPSFVHFTDVTLRDGQQQRTKPVSTEQRVAIFDDIVSTGVDRIEIGHLGNSKGDQQLANAIIHHIASQEEFSDGKSPYDSVTLQVLFGSQEDIIQDGMSVLQNAYKSAYGSEWANKMAEQIVVHVYDRLDENLRMTSTVPYSAEESAERICRAAKYAIEAGFTQFSISAEAATAVDPTIAAKFYQSVNSYLIDNGATAINNNLANTYGFSTNSLWNNDSLAAFNDAVKSDYPKGVISTSIHAHNDVANATDYSIMAIVAGFDRVESTHIGMGERAGNAASVDVMARMLEQARQQVLSPEKEAMNQAVSQIGSLATERTIKIDEKIIGSLTNWYPVGKKMRKIFGKHAAYRWHRTALGNPYAFDNGSGPHDQAMAKGITNPVENPPYMNYEWFLAVASLMGREIADRLAIGDPKAVDSVTVGSYTGGSKTEAIKKGQISRATVDEVAVAKDNFNKFKQKIANTAVAGFELYR